MGAWITPPTFWSQPVAIRSSGVQFQSPPMIHGPTNPESVKAIESKRSRLHLARMPPCPIMLNMYGLPTCTPPFPMADTLFMQKCPWAWRCFQAVTAVGSDMPMKLRTATDVPADLPPSFETRHGSIASDHLEFLAVCSACSRG